MNNSNAQPNTDFWLKVSQVPPELIRSVFSKYYNATVTSVPLSIGTSTVQVPAFDRMPSNMKVCVSCKTEFEDKQIAKKSVLCAEAQWGGVTGIHP